MWWKASNTKDEAGPDNDSEQRALRPPNYSNQCAIFSFRDISESGNHVS